MATLFKKVKIFLNDIFGGRLVKVSWEVISKISFKVFKKNDFFPKKKGQVLKNAPYLATLMKKYGNFWLYNTAIFSEV